MIAVTLGLVFFGLSGYLLACLYHTVCKMLAISGLSSSFIGIYVRRFKTSDLPCGRRVSAITYHNSYERYGVVLRELDEIDLLPEGVIMIQNVDISNLVYELRDRFAREVIVKIESVYENCFESTKTCWELEGDDMITAVGSLDGIRFDTYEMDLFKGMSMDKIVRHYDKRAVMYASLCFTCVMLGMLFV